MQTEFKIDAQDDGSFAVSQLAPTHLATFVRQEHAVAFVRTMLVDARRDDAPTGGSQVIGPASVGIGIEPFEAELEDDAQDDEPFVEEPAPDSETPNAEPEVAAALERLREEVAPAPAPREVEEPAPAPAPEPASIAKADPATDELEVDTRRTFSAEEMDEVLHALEDGESAKAVAERMGKDFYALRSRLGRNETIKARARIRKERESVAARDAQREKAARAAAGEDDDWDRPPIRKTAASIPAGERERADCQLCGKTFTMAVGQADEFCAGCAREM